MSKRFIILGNMNAIHYKEVFPLIKVNMLWLGCSSFNNGMYFKVPDDYVYADTYKFEREIDGVKVMRVAGICWFTNLTHSKRNQRMNLSKTWSRNASEYPKYDNYDAIEVSKVCDIPLGYNGVIGVPTTFLDKYCPEQFEILGISDRGSEYHKNNRTKIYTEKDYDNYNDLNVGAVIIKDGVPKITYSRILIRFR